MRTIYISFRQGQFSTSISNKVAAIKELRFCLNLGLKEAKDICDALWDQNNQNRKSVSHEVSDDILVSQSRMFLFENSPRTLTTDDSNTKKNIQKTLYVSLDKLVRSGSFDEAEDVLKMLRTVNGWN